MNELSSLANVSLYMQNTKIRIHKYIMMYQTQQNFIMFIIVLGQHISILIESSSGPSKNTDP